MPNDSQRVHLMSGPHEINKQSFIDEYGEQAYWHAVDCATLATMLSCDEQAQRFADVALQLLRDGYSKFPRTHRLFEATAGRIRSI